MTTTNNTPNTAPPAAQQDPKFIFKDGCIFHSEDGTPIPDDEPVVVFRGKDEVALIAMREYYRVMRLYDENRLANEHAQSMAERIEAFSKFQREHPERTGMGCHTCDHIDHRVKLADIQRNRPLHY